MYSNICTVLTGFDLDMNFLCVLCHVLYVNKLVKFSCEYIIQLDNSYLASLVFLLPPLQEFNYIKTSQMAFFITNIHEKERNSLHHYTTEIRRINLLSLPVPMSYRTGRLGCLMVMGNIASWFSYRKDAMYRKGQQSCVLAIIRRFKKILISQIQYRGLRCVYGTWSWYRTLQPAAGLGSPSWQTP